jgi:hypothetical protein
VINLPSLPFGKGGNKTALFGKGGRAKRGGIFGHCAKVVWFDLDWPHWLKHGQAGGSTDSSELHHYAFIVICFQTAFFSDSGDSRKDQEKKTYATIALT